MVDGCCERGTRRAKGDGGIRVSEDGWALEISGRVP